MGEAGQGGAGGAARIVDPGAAVYLDLLHLTLLFGLAGLLVFWIARQAMPLRRWGSHGTVFTGTLGAADLVVGAGFVAFYYFSGRAAAAMAHLGGGYAGHDQAVMLVAQTVLMQLLFAGLVAFYLGYLRRVELSEFFGLRRLKFKRLVGLSAAGLVASYLVVIVAAACWGLWLRRAGLESSLQEPVELLIGGGPVPLKVLLVLAAVVGAPLMEEVVFRGFLYPVMKRYSDRFFAAVFTAALFALAHNNLAAVGPLFALGLLFAVAFELTGSLVLPVVMHGLFNGTQIAVLLALGDKVELLQGG